MVSAAEENEPVTEAEEEPEAESARPRGKPMARRMSNKKAILLPTSRPEVERILETADAGFRALDSALMQDNEGGVLLGKRERSCCGGGGWDGRDEGVKVMKTVGDFVLMTTIIHVARSHLRRRASIIGRPWWCGYCSYSAEGLSPPLRRRVRGW